MTGLSLKTEAELAAAISQYYADPYGFVMFAYPWGVPTLPDGSPNPLAKKKGPEPWQRRLLEQLGRHIATNLLREEMGLDKLVARFARVSGHGVGKSALVAWLVQFFMSTRPDTRGAVTANTQTQLDTRTWPEMAKWHNLLINKHWFTWTATSYFFKAYPPERQRNYMFTAATVGKDNTEAFQGLHNEGKAVVVIFDEASGIDTGLWKATEGAFTDGEGFFFVFGNPNSGTGDFADCFGKYAHTYNREHIDARHVSHTNKVHLQSIIDKYGIDHDETKIRVLGQFPEQTYNGFIMAQKLLEAQERELHYDPGAALIMAVDVARYGRDSSVIFYRQGRDARSRNMLVFKGLSIVQLADRVANEANTHKPDAIVVESTGIGAGLIDVLRDRGFKIIEVHPGALSSEPRHYFRKRDELWSLARDWIYEHGCMPKNKELDEQLTGILYTLDRDEQRVKMESKEAFSERLPDMGSPDEADAFVLTFAVKLARRDRNRDYASRQSRDMSISDYDAHTY